MKNNSITLYLVFLGLTLIVNVQAAITGQQYCNKYMCVTGKHDNVKNIDTYTLEPPSGTNIPQSSFGWIAIGFGSTMINSPMVIVWPNSDGSITLSQRKATNHVTPTVDSNPPRKASLDTSSSFSDKTTTSITFTLPSSSNTNSTSIIWAYGTKNPGSSSSSSSFTQHLASGNTQLSLLATLTNNNSSTSTNGGSNSSSNSTSNSNSGAGSGSGSGIIGGTNKKVLIAHVVCGSLATMAILPIGILVPRIARAFTIDRWWFPLHGALNGIIAFGLITAAFAIAVSKFEGGFNSTHRKLGLTLFILALIQTLLGILTHYWQPNHKFQTSSGRGPSNFLHIILGLTIVGIGFGTVWKGIQEEWGQYSGSGNPNVGWKVGWGLIVAITAIAYIGGLYFLPKQLKLENERRQWASNIGQGKLPPSNGSLPPPPPPPNRPSHTAQQTPPTSQYYNQANPTVQRVTQPQSQVLPTPQSQSQSQSQSQPETRYVPPPPPTHPKRRLPPPFTGERPTSSEYEMSHR
ncbi:uncharacterized protein IL334_004664 [Kwoniella shivajii]|uniref:Cytochrome b561 domain-containing protein n=1 Tax=Kwoniella shivajii TaxID=564305 RepID=A0ABZ1D4Y8_9TREE|nr:hypothetical protein IL334_004664 [Kwoniella shivajii]